MNVIIAYFGISDMVSGKDDIGILTAPYEYYREVLTGDFVSSAVSFWTGTTQNFTVSGIPGGANVIKALLFWGCECNNPSDLANITFNGSPITGTVIANTSTLCWGTSSYYVYAADVTSFVSGNGTYTISVPQALPTTPGADGATLYVVYCDGTLPKRTISVYAMAQYLNTSSFSWNQTGFTATTTPSAKASLTVGDPQDGIPNDGYFNGNFIGYFDGTVPGNHYGFWEGDVSTWVPPSATSISWTLYAQCSGPCDCISPNVSVFSVTSVDSSTIITCSLGYDDGLNVSENGRIGDFGEVIYDINGRKVEWNQITRGVYFIISNGRARKLIVK